jgi:cytochrome c556
MLQSVLGRHFFKKGLSMKKTLTLWSTMGIGFLLLAACGGGVPADADTPAGQAFQYRQAVMRVLANKMTTIGGMAREEIPLDAAVFTKATADLAAVAGMLREGFEGQGAAIGSRTLPEAWTNWDDFSQKSDDLTQATQALADAAASGGFAAAQGMVQGTAGTCGACHRVYRERAE